MSREEMQNLVMSYCNENGFTTREAVDKELDRLDAICPNTITGRLERICFSIETLNRINKKEVTTPSDYVDISKFNLENQSDCLDYIFTELALAFGDKVVFKGGYMLMKLISNKARLSEDIDLSILNKEIYDEIKYRFECIGNKLVSEGVIVKYEVKPEVKQFATGGITMYRYDEYNQLSRFIGVDVGWHDVSWGVTNYTIQNVNVKGFEIERMLADKFTAILSRKRFRRPKDLYDVYIITSVYSFSFGKVREYIRKRNEGTETGDAEWRNWPFNETVLTEYGKGYESLVISDLNKNPRVKPPYKEAIERLTLLFNVLNDSNPERYTWDAVKGSVV